MLFTIFPGNVDPWLMNPPRFKGLNIWIPMIIPIKGRGFINYGPTLAYYTYYTTLVSIFFSTYITPMLLTISPGSL